VIDILTLRRDRSFNSTRAHAKPLVLRRGVLHGDTAFLQKPFTPDQLARIVRDVLDHAIVAGVN
jgi:hypothetical protein